MKIEAHIIAWNENETIHLTIKHYQQFCSKIIIYDNYSTDNTRSICESMGCEVKLLVSREFFRMWSIPNLKIIAGKIVMLIL